ncbi:MAG TPA: hypothetical protein VLT36_10845 [Candidatus Dormibacteraeota bacterium]|nr:hypothetical protein [Candidatus Dormibacteraeota bacterium]
MELELERWEEKAHARAAYELSAAELESLVQNIDQRNLVRPMREAKDSLKHPGPASHDADQKCRAALALQEKWNSWLAEREVLRDEIRRGKEFLDYVEQEMASALARLEDWPAYERQCGKNPLVRDTQSLSTHERIQQFLPGWLRRREERLNALLRDMEQCAQQNGLEHLI